VAVLATTHLPPSASVSMLATHSVEPRSEGPPVQSPQYPSALPPTMTAMETSAPPQVTDESSETASDLTDAPQPTEPGVDSSFIGAVERGSVRAARPPLLFQVPLKAGLKNMVVAVVPARDGSRNRLSQSRVVALGYSGDSELLVFSRRVGAAAEVTTNATIPLPKGYTTSIATSGYIDLLMLPQHGYALVRVISLNKGSLLLVNLSSPADTLLLNPLPEAATIDLHNATISCPGGAAPSGGSLEICQLIVFAVVDSGTRLDWAADTGRLPAEPSDPSQSRSHSIMAAYQPFGMARNRDVVWRFVVEGTPKALLLLPENSSAVGATSAGMLTVLLGRSLSRSAPNVTDCSLR
jgi:hypothetical protein